MCTGMPQAYYRVALEQLNNMHIDGVLLNFLCTTASCSVLSLFLHYVLHYIHGTET